MTFIKWCVVSANFITTALVKLQLPIAIEAKAKMVQPIQFVFLKFQYTT